MEYGLATFCLLACFLGAVSANLNVSIYFESLCPDSKKFIVTQFAPAFLEKGLKDDLTPDFVPYGHYNDSAKTCQHGDNECQGNILLACGLNKLSTDEEKVKFVQCIMNATIPTNTSVQEVPKVLLEQCKAVVPGSSYNSILDCATQEEGKTLNDMYKVRTNKFFNNATFGVPYVAVNNTKNDELSKRFTEDFLKTFCGMSSANLTVCGGKSSASIFTASLIPAVLALVLARL